MSFILDALRKSEHERQRSSAPSLSHVPVAAPRRHVPLWALVVIGVLTAAVLVLAGAWWQAQRPPVAAQISAAAPGTPQAATNAPSLPATPAPIPRTEPPPLPVAAGTAPPPAPVPAPAPAVAPAAVAIAPADEPAAASLAGAVQVPQPAAPTGPTQSVTALREQGISVPALHLELHAYSDKPAERFVFINGRKYREGERLAEGPEVVNVEPNGVVLSQQGHRFMLAPE